MSQNQEERIKDMIGEIQPAAGARDRILEEIYRKAREESEIRGEAQSDSHAVAPIPGKKAFGKLAWMKWALPVAAGLALVLLAANLWPGLFQKPSVSTAFPTDSETPLAKTLSPASTQEALTATPPLALVGNPFRQVEGPGDFEKELGFSLQPPAGAEKAEYYVVDGQRAQISFSLAQHEYDLQAFKGEEESSLYYGEEDSRSVLDPVTGDVLIRYRDEATFSCLISWKRKEIQYGLYNSDGASEEAMRKIYEAIK